jgi:hypothetical protein
LSLLQIKFKSGFVDKVVKKTTKKINSSLKKSFMCDTIYKEKQEKEFSEFKSVASAGDTTIFPIFKPYSVLAEAKEYFSGKHNI